MKQYRTVLSEKVFHYLLHEIFKSLPYTILNTHEQQLDHFKIEHPVQSNIFLHNKDCYIVKTNLGLFTVKCDSFYEDSINEQRRKMRGKWRC